MSFADRFAAVKAMLVEQAELLRRLKQVCQEEAALAARREMRCGTR